jgi:hypothetical protein
VLWVLVAPATWWLRRGTGRTRQGSIQLTGKVPL